MFKDEVTAVGNAAKGKINLLEHNFTGYIMMSLLAGLYILFSTLVKINPHRRRSIVTFSLFGLITLVGGIFKSHFPVGLGCVLISAVVVIKHLPRFDQEPAGEQEKLHSTL